MTAHSSPVTAMKAVSAMEDEAYLTDHEWRLRQAREGKAIYVPGRPVEVVKAEIEVMRKSRSPASNREKIEVTEVALSLTKKDAQAFHRAADDVEYLLGITSTFLETIRLGIGGGFLSDNENGLNALLDLGARGLRHAEENEGRTLGKLGMRFRDLGLKHNDEAEE